MIVVIVVKKVTVVTVVIEVTVVTVVTVVIVGTVVTVVTNILFHKQTFFSHKFYKQKKSQKNLFNKKLKSSNCDEIKNLNCDETQKLKL